MCLSTIYIEQRRDGAAAMSEVARVVEVDGGVEAVTLFGEERRFEGFTLAEVSLTENYVVLRAARGTQ